MERSSGTTVSFTVNVPIGCTSNVWLPGVGVVSVTLGPVPEGSAALQLAGFFSALNRSGKTGFWGIVACVLLPQVRSTEALTVKNNRVIDASPCRWKGVGPEILPLTLSPA